MSNKIRANKKNIPVNPITDSFSKGIAIDKMNIKKSDFKEAGQSHRDEGHVFHIIEKGSVIIEIDFKEYKIKAPAVVYMHPNQVHRITDFQNMTVCSLAIKNENLHPEYLELLETIAPAMPLTLTKSTNVIVADIFYLCLQFSEQRANKLSFSLLKDSCNTLVAFLIAQFLNQEKSESSFTRAEIVTKSFRRILDNNFSTCKQPRDYAEKLNISTPYLNQCVKATTGIAVSQHIRDRIILEAKRLLHHTNKSVKEIAFELGYIDYPYFTRLFTKATGMSALTFRNIYYD